MFPTESKAYKDRYVQRNKIIYIKAIFCYGRENKKLILKHASLKETNLTFICFYSLTYILDSRREEPSLLLVLKWGGELTPAGRVQAEELGRAFRCMYPGGQGKSWSFFNLVKFIHCFFKSSLILRCY